MRAILFGLALTCAAACGDSKAAPKDAPPISDGGNADASCFTNPNPTSNYEIINACTTAQKIYKPGKPPLLNPDGTLPPLP
jgi:hypothetical protein